MTIVKMFEGLFRKNIHVSEDFPSRVIKWRNDLLPFLRGALKSGKRAYLKYDKLFIDKDRYVFNEGTDDIKECNNL